jgi:hypothetical protein
MIVISTTIIKSHQRFPDNKLKESGGRKRKNIISVIKNIKGKLTPVYVLKFTRRIDNIALSRVLEPA